MRIMPYKKVTCAMALITTGLVAEGVSAGGFYLIESSGSGMGNAFAGAAVTVEDPSVFYFNPAGISKLKERELSVALHWIRPESSFKNSGSTAATEGALSGSDARFGDDALIPNLYYSQPLSNGLTFGLGFNAPFGLKTEYNDDWVGRYHAVTSDMKTVNINPGLAWQVNEKLSLGFGVNAQYANVILTSAVDFGAICTATPSGQAGCASIGVKPQENDGFADLEADNWGWGYNFGLMYDITPTSRLGFNYRSKVKHEVDGEADFSVPSEVKFIQDAGGFADTDLTAEVTLPEIISLGYRHQTTDKLGLVFDWTWTRWSRFEELRIQYENAKQPDSVTTENWNDASRFAIGLDYRVDSRLLLRSGIALDETPIPNAQLRTPRIPGNDRRWFTFGFGYVVTPSIDLDFGYAHLFLDRTDINNQFESGTSEVEHTLTGSYKATVNIYSAQINWKF